MLSTLLLLQDTILYVRWCRHRSVSEVLGCYVHNVYMCSVEYVDRTLLCCVCIALKTTTCDLLTVPFSFG
jgi:hypothetical protein